MYSHCHDCLYVVKWLVNLCEQILTFKKINLKDRDFPIIHFGVSLPNSCTFSSHHTIPDQIHHHHHHHHHHPAVFGGITTNAGLWQIFWEPTWIALSPFTIRSSGNLTAKLDWLLCSQSCPCPQQLWKEERDDQMTSSFDMLLLKRKVRLGWVNLCWNYMFSKILI